MCVNQALALLKYPMGRTAHGGAPGYGVRFSITRVDGHAYALCCLCWRHVDRAPHPHPEGDVMRPRPQSTDVRTRDVVVDTHHVRFSDTELLLNLL